MLSKELPEEQPFEIRGSAIQGRGGFATRRIAKGERIAEYVGERISWKEADRRYDDEGMKRHHTFLFSVTSRTVIDAAVGGNDSRFINHSCDPNCEAVDEKGRIFIEAIKNIPKGTELTYDYAFERDESTAEEDEKLYACRCGSRNCRGTILAPLEATPPHTHHSAARHPRRDASSSRGRSLKRKSSRGATKRRRSSSHRT
jgi:SET domain-containing protein